MGDATLAPGDSIAASTSAPAGESLDSQGPVAPKALWRVGLQWGRPGLAECGSGASMGSAGSQPFAACQRALGLQPHHLQAQLFTGPKALGTAAQGHCLLWSP